MEKYKVMDGSRETAPCGLAVFGVFFGPLLACRPQKFDRDLVAIVLGIVAAQREVLLRMRSKSKIGDDAFHQVEAQLDVAELNALGAEYP